MLNPFSDFQLISYAVDGEIRLWDIQDLGCVKVIHIEGSIGLLNVVAHPTDPNILFAVIITKKEAGSFYFILSQLRRHSLLEAGPVQHHVPSSLSAILTLSTNTIDRVILEATGSDVYLAVRPVDVSFTCPPPSLLPQPQTLWRPSTRTAASSPSP